jgi:hypothetical protein
VALLACRECRKEVAKSANVCPHCGAGKPTATRASRTLRVIIGILLGASAFWYLLEGNSEEHTGNSIEDIYKKVALDAVGEYTITSRSGSAVDRCVQAGVVAAAFLQAKNGAAYEQWKITEASDCRAAGIPSM